MTQAGESPFFYGQIFGLVFWLDGRLPCTLSKAEHIEDLIAPTVEDMGFELVRVRFLGTDRLTLQIMAERPDGSMSVDDYADLSRAISAILDVADPVAG